VTCFAFVPRLRLTHLFYEFQKLTFGSTRITEEQYVDIPSQPHPVWQDLLAPSEQQARDRLLDVCGVTLSTKASGILISRSRLTQTPENTRCYASSEPLIQIITPAQPQKLFLLGWCKVLQPSTSSSQ
jgi:hypothetical protein